MVLLILIFLLFILTRSLNELMTQWFVRLVRDQTSSLHSKLKRVEGVSSAGSWIPFVVDNSKNLMSTLRVCMNEEMMLPSSLIIWFEGSSCGPSHSHFPFFSY